MNINDILSHYLEYKLGLKPSNPEYDVEWDTEECNDCGSITYILKINGFEPGIKVTSDELLSYVLDTKLYLNSDNQVRYYKD